MDRVFFEKTLQRAEALMLERRYKEALELLDSLDLDNKESKEGVYARFLKCKALFLDTSYKEASEVLESLLQSSERAFGHSHQFTMTLLELMAKSKSRAGEHKDASRCYLRNCFSIRGNSPKDIRMISDSYELYCKERAIAYKKD